MFLLKLTDECSNTISCCKSLKIDPSLIVIAKVDTWVYHSKAFLSQRRGILHACLPPYDALYMWNRWHTVLSDPFSFQAVKVLAKHTPMLAKNPRKLQLEADINRLFLYTRLVSHYHLSIRAYCPIPEKIACIIHSYYSCAKLGPKGY